MGKQIIQDHQGNPTGVFIPLEDWKKLKSIYPNIDEVNEDLPQWQKDLIDKRLKDLGKEGKFKPIEALFDFLDNEL